MSGIWLLYILYLEYRLYYQNNDFTKFLDTPLGRAIVVTSCAAEAKIELFFGNSAYSFEYRFTFTIYTLLNNLYDYNNQHTVYTFYGSFNVYLFDIGG